MSQRIEFEVVGNANFASIYTQLDKLRISIANLNSQSIGAGFTKELEAGLKNAEGSFLTTVNSLRGMQVETVKVSDATAHLTEQFVKSRLSTSQYFDIWKNRSKETIPILNDIAQQQAKVANSFIVPSAAKAGYAQVITDMGSVAQKSMVAGIQQKAYNTAMMDASNKIINFGKNTQWAGRQLTVGFTVPLAAAGVALANMYYQVDKNMQMLQRTYGIGGAAGQAFTKALPSQAELDKIKTQVQQVAQQMANMYGQSAQETTSVAAALSAAGYTQDQLINLTKTVSQAMVLGETDMQSAMKATISLQTAYKLSTSQTADAMNFFSAAQAATSTTMKDLIDAIPRVGPIVQNLGGTYKDTVAFLVAMKEGGVGASDGANALKNSLQRLIVPTKAAVTELKAYGIDLPNIVKENTGNVVGMVESLQMALNKLPQLARQQAITELFGKFQAARVTALLDNFNKTGTQSAKVMNMMSLSSKELTDIATQQTNVLQQSSSGKFKIAVESLKTSLLPIGQAFLDMATKVLNAVTGIVNIFQKLGPLKYIIGGLLGGAAILGPIIMFSGLMANLVGQVFKLTNMMRMFKEGAGSGGGWSSPFKAIQGGLSGLANYFEEIDKAQLASSRLSGTISSQMGTQAKMLDLFNVALTRYTDNIQRLMQIEAGSKFGPGNIGGLGGPGGGSPIGGGPYIVPSSGGGGAARTPEQVLAQAGYVNTMFITGKDETGKGIRRNLVEQTEMGPMGGVTFSHGLANEVTQNIMGSRSIVPGIFTNTPQGKEINLKNQDQTLPLIPSQMMTAQVVTTVLNELGIKPQGSISAYGKELSTVTAVKQSGDQLAQLRALRQIETVNPNAVSSFKSLAKMGANYEDTNSWFNQQLGPEQWAGMRQKAMADVKNTYDQAFNSFEASIKASGGTGVKPENFRAIATNFYKSTSSMFLEQYNGMSTAMQNALTVTSTQTGEKLADRIRGSMKDSLAPAMINSLAASSNGLEYLGTAFNELGTTVQDATKKMAAEVTALTEKINLIAAESMVGGVGKVSMPGNVGRVIPKFASGGKITGPGGPRDDKIPALLSNGEYVVNAAAVSQYGNGFLDAINTRKFADGGRVANTNYENAPAQISPTMGESVTTPRYAMGGMTQDVSREMLYDSSMGYAKGGSARRKGSFTHHRQFGYHPRRFKYASGGLAALSEMFMAKKEMFSSAQIESYLRTPESLYIGNAVDKFFMTRNADALKNVKTEDIARVIESHQLNNSEKEAQLAAALELHASGRYGQKEPLRNLDPQIVSAGAKSIQDALAQVPGDTVRLYRAVTFPNNGVDTGRNLAPGHFGYTAGPIEAPQPYYSMSLDPTLPMNFARPSDSGETGRVIEIDVPKSAIIGIQGANYSGKLGEREFIVKADGIPQSGQRYVNPYGLASIPKNAEDPFLSRLAPPGPESIKFTVQDISQRYRKQKPSGADYAIQGWAGASDKDRYGITPEELKFAQQYLEGKYSMPMSELKKGKYDKMFPTQGYNVASEDYYIRQMLQHQLGYRKYDPLLPIIADKPGMASYVFSEPMITGRKDGGMISKFVDGGGPGKGWTLSELWASSGGENLFVNHLSQNEDLLKLVMSEIIGSKEIKQLSKDKLLSTIPFNLNPRNTDYAPTVEQDFSKILKKMLDENAFGEQNPDFYARLGATIAMPDYRSYTPSLLEQAGGNDKTIYGGLTSKGTVRRDAPYEFRSLSRQAASESMQIAPGSELDKSAMARDIVATHFSDLGFGKSFLAEIEKRLSTTYLNTHTAHGFARGSYVSGPGGPKDDMIPAMLSNGEYVVNADAVKHYGVGFVDAINSRKFADGGIAKFAGGSGGSAGESMTMIPGGIGRQVLRQQESDYAQLSTSVKELIGGFEKVPGSVGNVVTSMTDLAKSTEETKSLINSNSRKPSGKPSGMGQSIISGSQEESIVSRYTPEEEMAKNKGGSWGKFRGKLDKMTGGQMGRMMGAQMLSGVASVASSNMAEANGGNQTMASGALGGAATGLSMGSMFGPYGMMAGAAGGALIGAGLAKQEQAAKDTTDAINKITEAQQSYRDSLSVSTDSLAAFGLKAKSISDMSFSNVAGEASGFRTAVDNLAESMKNGSDSTKGMISYLKNAFGEDLARSLKDQFLGILQAGGDNTQAKAQLEAAAKASGVSGIDAAVALKTVNESLKGYGGKGQLSKQAGSFIEDFKNSKGFDFNKAKKDISNAEGQRIADAKSRQEEYGAGSLSGSSSDLMVGLTAFTSGAWITGALNNIKQRGVMDIFDLKGSKQAMGLGNNGNETNNVDWVKTLNLRGVSDKFNINDLVTNRDTYSQKVQDKAMSGKDIFASGDNGLIDAAKAAGVTLNSTAAEVDKMFTKLNGTLSDLQGQTGAQQAIQGFVEMNNDFKAQFVEPMKQAMASLSPEEFKQSVGSMVTAMTNAGGDVKSLVDQISNDMGPEFAKMAPQFDQNTTAAENYLVALKDVYALQNSGLQFNSKGAAANAQNLIGSNPALHGLAADQASTFSNINNDSNALISGVNNIPQKKAADLQKQASKVQKDAAAQTKAIERNAQAEVKNIDDQIKAKNKYIDSIKKEMDARQKLYDKKQQQMQQDLTLQNLQNGISKARNSGDLLGLALAQSAYNDELDRQAALKKKDAADAADQKKIDTAGSQIQNLQDQAQKIQDAASAAAQAIQDAAAATEDRIQKRIQGLGAEQKKYQDMAATVQTDLTTWTTLLESGQGESAAGKNAKKALDDIIAKLPDGARQAAQAQESAIVKEWSSFASKNKFMIDAAGNLTSLGVPRGTIGVSSTGALTWTNGQGASTIVIGGETLPVSANSSQHDERAQHAQGGPIYGPGTKTSDSIPAMLSHGEYVVKASSVDKYGTGFLNAINSGNYAEGGFIRKFVKGGPVSNSSTDAGTTTSQSATQVPASLSGSQLQNAIVKLAKEYAAPTGQNVPYRNEGDGVGFGKGMADPSPAHGWGCATSVAWLFEQFGIGLPSKTLSYDDYRGLSQSVPKAGLSPTDLLFFHYANGVNIQNPVNHVGMYVGGGKMFQAQNHRAGTAITGIDWGNYVGAKRVIGSSTSGSQRAGADRAGGAGGSGSGGSTPSTGSTTATTASLIKQISKMIVPINGQIPFADGGLVNGPGTGRSDSINARLSRGEYVINANATSKYGTELMAALNAGALNPTFQTPAKRVTVATQGSESISNRSSSNIQYNVNVNVEGSNASPQEIARVVISTIKQREKSNTANRRIG